MPTVGRDGGRVLRGRAWPAAVAVVLVLVGCGDASDPEARSAPSGERPPPDADVVTELFAREYGDVVDIEAIEIRNSRLFANPGDKEPRYNVEFDGRASLKQDLLQQANADEWYGECSGARSRFPVGDHPFVYRRTAAAGQEIGLAGDGSFSHERDRWELGGHLLEYRGDSGRLDGNAASTFGPDAVVIGTPEFDAVCQAAVAQEGAG
jgi:hypothetical protein